MSEKKDYKVANPFRRNGAVFRKGTIALTAEEATPLLAAQLIEEIEQQEAASNTADAAKLQVEGAEKSRTEQFSEAVAKLDNTNKAHFTNANKPDVKALAAVGFVVTAQERDELWLAVNQAE